MREILVIGIGAGDPEYITVEAVNALNATDVFFVVDKGGTKDNLLGLRREVCERYIQGNGYRMVSIAEPHREHAATLAGHEDGVTDWHQRRAALFEAAIIDNLPQDGRGAFLVWGDPTLYDSTLRVIDQILARGEVSFDYRVIPGITSVQVLAAKHRVPLSGIGEPVHITTGRRLAHGLPEGVDSAVVMLDADFAAAGLDDPDLHVYWGAYLGTAEEVMRSGPLREVGAQIAATKLELRERHGWIMDTYLLRREPRG